MMPESARDLIAHSQPVAVEHEHGDQSDGDPAGDEQPRARPVRGGDAPASSRPAGPVSGSHRSGFRRVARLVAHATSFVVSNSS